MKLDALAQMEYPGRFIIMGRDATNQYNVTVYGITGRSESSQARKLKAYEGGRIVTVETTDARLLEKGSPSLLTYNCLVNTAGKTIVSNGRQTDLIYNESMNSDDPPFCLLDTTFSKSYKVPDSRFGEIDLTQFEPDAPNWTPRISALSNGETFAFSSIYRSGGKRSINLNLFFAARGKGRLLTTYTGANSDPLPSFTAGPIEVEIYPDNVSDLVSSVYNSLAPKEDAKDFRVGVVAVYTPVNGGSPRTTIINRVDLEEKS